MRGSVLLVIARMLPATDLRLTLALGLVMVVQPLLGLGFMLAVGSLVARIPAIVEGNGDGWIWAFGLVAGIYVAQQLLNSIATLVEWHLGRRLNNALDDRVMALLQRPSGIGHLEDDRIRDLAAEVSDGLGAGWWRPSKVPAAFRSVVAAGLGLVLAFGAAIWVNWWLGLVLTVVASWALYTVTRHSLEMILGLMQASGDPEFRRMEYERDLVVAPYAAKEVRLFGFAPWALDRWESRLMRVLALDLKNIARVTPSTLVSVAALTLVTAGGFVWALVSAGRGDLGLAAATVLAQAVLAPMAGFGPAGQSVIDLAFCSRPVRGLFELEEKLRTRRSQSAVSGGPDPGAAPAFWGDLRLKDVCFRYPGTQTDVLRGLTLEVPAGSSLAVVGLNGAGKTTLVKLLCRFYEPSRGSIAMGATDLAAVDAARWQRGVAAIFQDFARYPYTAADNVGFGDLSAPRDRLDAVAARVGLAEVVEGLPYGWDTVLSREYTGGTDLSGGQWQRVALGRALLAAEAGAGLLILDEPASNLDVRAEAELNDRFLDLTHGTTTIVISHRFSTVRRADRICVLDEGRVVETGTHDELVEAGGRYAALFKLQAERFAV